MIESVALEAGAKVIVAKFFDYMMKSAGNSVNDFLKNSKNNLSGHFEQNYLRCSQLKTILNRDIPVNILDIYIGTNFTSSAKKYDHYELIDKIFEKKNITIIGTGGGGKTVFMKYLWISMFINPREKIPIFIELRRINEFSIDGFINYAYYNIANAKESNSRVFFDRALREGKFAFILDGFDELKQDKRTEIEKEIIECTNKFPDNIFVISSRPDERFDGWQSFQKFKVSPLDQNQVISLVGKLNFEKKVKEKFLVRLKNDLYKNHASFLSTPLLTTLMILTFDQFADIPEKIHIFYEQTFDTLYGRHDATKEAYKREFHTSFPIDVFKRFFSFFCMISYSEQQYELTEVSALEIIQKIAKIENKKIDGQKFLLDLLESVCLLQRDGSIITFAHRSFQEYFTALCVSRRPDYQAEQLLNSFANRVFDSVFPMIFDMDRDMIERLYIVPIAHEIINSAEPDDQSSELDNFIFNKSEGFEVFFSPKRVGIFHIDLGKYNSYKRNIHRLYPSYFKEAYDRLDEISKNAKAISNSIDNYVIAHSPIKRKKSASLGIAVFGGRASIMIRDTKSILMEPDAFKAWFDDTQLKSFFAVEYKALKKIKFDVEARNKSRDKTIEEIFKI